MNRGKGINSPEKDAAKNTKKSSNSPGKVTILYEECPEPEDFPPPSYLSAEAREHWIDRIRLFKQRGQSISGSEPMLAQLCELNANLNKTWASGRVPSMAELNTFRMYSAEFFQTPASRIVKVAATPNKPSGFGNRGKAPAKAG